MKIKFDEFSIYFACIVSLYISRILVHFHLPSILNFLHFAFLILGILVSIKDGKIKIKSKLSIAIFITAFSVILSAVFNAVMPLNCVLVLLIILEPFIIAESSHSWKEKNFITLENTFLFLSFLNLIISYFQYFVLNKIDDEVTGIFFGMGSGAHINGAFCMITAVYFLYTAFSKKKGKLKSLILSLLFLAVIIMSDNKQSILAYGIGAVMLLILNTKNIRQTIKVLSLLVVGFVAVYFLSFSVLSKIVTWTSNTEGMLMGLTAKFSFIDILDNFRSNSLSYLFGLGPGMTLSRVARLLPEYSSILSFGITISPITSYFAGIYSNSWIMKSSSMWAFYFSWAAYFGDLGIVGLVSVVLLYLYFYKNFCKTIVNKYIWAIVISHGMIFDWLEEPSFVVAYFIIILLLNHKFEEESDSSRKIVRMLGGRS